MKTSIKNKINGSKLLFLTVFGFFSSISGLSAQIAPFEVLNDLPCSVGIQWEISDINNCNQCNQSSGTIIIPANSSMNITLSDFTGGSCSNSSTACDVTVFLVSINGTAITPISVNSSSQSAALPQVGCAIQSSLMDWSNSTCGIRY